MAQKKNNKWLSYTLKLPVARTPELILRPLPQQLSTSCVPGHGAVTASGPHTASTLKGDRRGSGSFQHSVVMSCGSAGKESACNVGDLGSIPGLGRFPWRRERLPISVIWAGQFHEPYSPWGCKESDTTEQLSLHTSLQSDVQVASELERGESSKAQGCIRCCQGRPFQGGVFCFFSFQFY